MHPVARRALTLLPPSWQHALRRLHHQRMFRRGLTSTGEPEESFLPMMLSPGDWVLDIGANVGHYSALFSRLVGDAGRVIAVEPVPETFLSLAANLGAIGARNVTLLNVAATAETALVGMLVPPDSTGLENPYVAHIVDPEAAGFSVLAVRLDTFVSSVSRIRVVKIDAEGHELAVLRGLADTIGTHRPELIVEHSSNELLGWLAAHGYRTRRLKGSPNLLGLTDRCPDTIFGDSLLQP